MSNNKNERISSIPEKSVEQLFADALYVDNNLEYVKQLEKEHNINIADLYGGENNLSLLNDDMNWNYLISRKISPENPEELVKRIECLNYLAEHGCFHVRPYMLTHYLEHLAPEMRSFTLLQVANEHAEKTDIAEWDKLANSERLKKLCLGLKTTPREFDYLETNTKPTMIFNYLPTGVEYFQLLEEQINAEKQKALKDKAMLFLMASYYRPNSLPAQLSTDVCSFIGEHIVTGNKAKPF